MRNDRDEKDESHDESGEYHFSDDEVSYEVENASSQPSQAASRAATLGGGNASRIKRFGIIAVVFLVLLGVVYKFLMPSQTTNMNLVNSKQPTTTNRSLLANSNVTKQPSAPSTSTPAVVATVTPPATATMQPSTMPMQTNAMPPGSPTPSQTPASQPAMTQQYPVAATPSYPMANANPDQANNNVNATPATPNSIFPNQINNQDVDAKIAEISANNEKMASQLQADYTQKISDLETQNKELQKQLEVLNTRVANSEAQLTQLIQALIRQSQGNTNAPIEQPPASPTGPLTSSSAINMGAAIQQKLSYNVQAIIPGRAWLKSDNGETLTVAEGDVIRDLGRVMKIDPYDGVVEINTGNRTVSLSYGNQG